MVSAASAPVSPAPGSSSSAGGDRSTERRLDSWVAKPPGPGAEIPVGAPPPTVPPALAPAAVSRSGAIETKTKRAGGAHPPPPTEALGLTGPAVVVVGARRA